MRLSIIAALLALSILAAAQKIPLKMYDSMRWRCIGPHRAGRTVGASGVPGKPNVFYMGVNNGGVWKTTDYGRVWKPVFDEQSTGSIGFLAVAPSQPDTVYVGTGEGLHRPDLAVGDGMFKSTDGGKTWAHIGLKDAQQIPSIAVDPKNPDRVFVAVLGHPYGPNAERGVYRTLDGGKSWLRVLRAKDDDTGATAVQFDPKNPNIVWAALWEARQAPWENGEFFGPGSGLFKSIDGGLSWTRKTTGMPGFEQGLQRIGFAIAPTNPKLMMATVEARQGGGIYKSEDGGESWKLISEDRRLWGRGNDFAEVDFDPKNPDVIYIGNTACYKSTDGGKTWTCWKGAPGGDDYHTIWINPENPEIVLLATDQGATITVNGGETWSSWYNQPTAQFYHVAADNQFPYSLYSGQQESGSAGVLSRGNQGQITFREWSPMGGDEYCYSAPDPLNPRYVYGGRINRYDKVTGEVVDIRPRSEPYRVLRTAPVVFSPVDQKSLYFATNFLWRTLDGGKNWQKISPDLSRETYDIPASIGKWINPDMATMARRGVIYAVAPSKQTVDTIWAGTDDGLIHVTNDGGKSWANVTPPQLKSWMKVSQLDAGSFDNQTCYAAIDAMRCDDWKPHIYRTHDGGRTWKEIVSGIPEGEVVRAVREDPVRKGLLFCSTERQVWFSIDDGENWSPLRLNMPATSVRDVIVAKDDLAIGTHGRSYWILDDITPLRQIQAGMGTTLFKPQDAYLVEWNRNTDTPLPPEEPAGKNPTDGAILNYFLSARASKVTLEVLDSSGAVIRVFSSDDKPETVDFNTVPYPAYWARAPQILGKEKGSHRFIWDMRPPAAPGGRRGLPMAAIFGDTPVAPRPPMVAPGVYRVRLTVDGAVQEKELRLLADPRR